MTSENLIHVKLEYREALIAKKDLLSSEMALLKIAKTIREYHSYRDNEFELKINLYKKIKELKSNMWKLQKTLPKLRIPEILKKGTEEVKSKQFQKKKYPNENLEDQLQEIQRKLNELQNKP